MTTSPPTLYACAAFTTENACAEWVAIPPPSGWLDLTPEEAEEIAWSFALALVGIFAIKLILRPPKKEVS